MLQMARTCRPRDAEWTARLRYRLVSSRLLSGRWLRSVVPPRSAVGPPVARCYLKPPNRVKRAPRLVAGSADRRSNQGVVNSAAPRQDVTGAGLTRSGGHAMAENVTLIGSRVSSMHLAYDCLGCGNTVPVSITDGKASSGDRRLAQRPSDCPKCGARIAITLVAEPSQGARVAH